jgi:SAM-dependent methyltransferase
MSSLPAVDITRIETGADSTGQAIDAARIEWLTQALSSNRFLPEPPESLRFVGDGDFRLIGAEFVGHFLRYGGLKPWDRVLDLGCGIGRMAVPLTQYLDPKHGSYDGVDVVSAGIGWCAARITPVYPRFHFHHLDLANALYNPTGAVSVADAGLPFDDSSFDFITATSVITHLPPEDVVAYAREIARLLRPGGRCFLSLFLMNDAARRNLAAGAGRPDFAADGPGPVHYADADVPLAAVAYDEPALVKMFADAGLAPAAAPGYGHWSGRSDGVSFQDLCLFSRPAEAT